MTSYKDRLRKGSFRGVNFFTDTADFEGGKRVKMHEFSGRDKPFTEDMRRKGHVYTINGYLIGDDVFSQRDEFIRACEREGYGILVHPFLGLLNVEAGSLKISESITEGRIVKFSCEFYEKGEASNPGSSTNKVGKFFSKIDGAFTSIQDQFVNTFSVANKPQYILEAATETVQTANDTFLSVFGQISDPSDYVSNIKASVLSFQDAAGTLISNPSEFITDLSDIISSIGSITNSHKNKQDIYNKIISFDDDLPTFPESTDTRSVQRTNQDAIVNFIQTATYIMAMRDFVAAVNNTYPDEETRLRYATNDAYFSFDDLESRKTELMNGFDAIITAEVNNDVYEDLNGLESLMFECLPSPDDVESKIKKVVTYTPNETLSSLVVTYDLYEAPDNEQDIIDRNRIKNPCFVVGGEELEVLS